MAKIISSTFSYEVAKMDVVSHEIGEHGGKITGTVAPVYVGKDADIRVYQAKCHACPADAARAPSIDDAKGTQS